MECFPWILIILFTQVALPTPPMVRLGGLDVREIDEIRLIRSDATVVLRAYHRDTGWWLAEPEGGPGDGVVSNKMLNAVRRPITLQRASVVAGRADLLAKGLDPEHALRVEFYSDDVQQSALVLGRHPWVMRPDEPGVIYRLQGPQLSRVFDLPVSRLRRKDLGLSTPPLCSIYLRSGDRAGADDLEIEAVGGSYEHDGTFPQPARRFLTFVRRIRPRSFVFAQPSAETGLLDDASNHALILNPCTGEEDSVVLIVGAEVENGEGWYAMLDGAGYYFIITSADRDRIIEGFRTIVRRLARKQASPPRADTTSSESQ